MGHIPDTYLLLFVSVSRDGQHRKGAAWNLHQDRLLPDPECRAAQRVRHHTADHHVRRADQPGLAGPRETSWKSAAAVSARRRAGK